MNLTRRLFLGRGSAIAAAVATPATIGAPTAVAAPVSASAALNIALEEGREGESPEMLKLGADLLLARRRYADAQDTLQSAQERALRLAPPIPHGLPVPFGISVFGQLSWYTLAEPADILGNPVELPRYENPKSGKLLPVRVPTTAGILKDRQCGRRWNHGHLPAWQKGEHRRLYNLAVQFEQEIYEAREASGLNDAEDELWRSKWAIEELTNQIRKVEAKTLVGLLIKAQAANAIASLTDEHDPSGPRLKGAWIGAGLAQDFERIMGEAA